MAFSSSRAILSLVVGMLLLLCAYRVVWRQFFGEQDCEMTYMYEWPQYQVDSTLELKIMLTTISVICSNCFRKFL